jgi:two-component system chemotaxis response regulator CheB
MVKLLVIDDSALMRRLLREIFTAEGDFEVRTARDGAEALATVAAFAPDVVTLDVNMPGMDGLDCLSRIMLEAPRPVVMVSSVTREGAEATLEALRLGAVDFVAKPDGTPTLSIDRIRPVLVQKVRAAAGARLRQSFRLRERVRHRIGTPLGQAAPAGARARPLPPPAGPSGPGAAAAPAPAPPAMAPVAGVVLIGASTGGPNAVETVLSGLPGDFPWPILVAQHMPASFTGPFARRLDQNCAVRVVEVAVPIPLRPGWVHVGRGDADLILGLRGDGLAAVPAPPLPSSPWHPSVDRLVTSALMHLEPSRILGVLMTGMGRDGAEAMSTLRSRGGRTVAEDESTAVVWGMPGELVRMGGAEVVVPLPDIAGAILRLVS